MREQVLTKATLLTFFRAGVSTVVLVAAIIEQSHATLIAGLVFSMVFDFADGQVARRYKDETIFGAQLDGIADRIATALVAAGMVSMNPDTETVIAATFVWIQFGVVDQHLTSQFLRFGLWSPDHFYQLRKPLDDPSGEPLGERVWRRNWSALAKLASNLPIVFLAAELWWAAIALSLFLILVRVPCYRLIRILARDLAEARYEEANLERRRYLPNVRPLSGRKQPRPHSRARVVRH